jgi:hypothetical protein
MGAVQLKAGSQMIKHLHRQAAPLGKEVTGTQQGCYAEYEEY